MLATSFRYTWIKSHLYKFDIRDKFFVCWDLIETKKKRAWLTITLDIRSLWAAKPFFNDQQPNVGWDRNEIDEAKNSKGRSFGQYVDWRTPASSYLVAAQLSEWLKHFKGDLCLLLRFWNTYYNLNQILLKLTLFIYLFEIRLIL